MGNGLNNRLAQAPQHIFEQHEGFALILVQRIALGVSAQADALAQVIQRQQMVFPKLVENLQQHALFGETHDLRAIFRFLGRHRRIGGLGNALQNFFVGDAFFLRPIGQGEIEGEQTQGFGVELADIPLLSIGRRRNAARYQILNHLMAHFFNHGRAIFGIHDFAALLVNHLALIVHHIVEAQQVFTDFEVPRFHPLLGFGKGLIDPGVNDGFALFQPQLLQHPVHPVSGEDAH